MDFQKKIEDNDIDLLQLFVYLKGRWKFLLIFLFLGVFVGIIASQWVRAEYSSNILLQIDVKSNSGRAFGEMGALLDVNSPADAEIQLIKSRMVLSQVVEKQKLRFLATPTSMQDRLLHQEGRMDLDTLVVPRSMVEAKIGLMARVVDSTHFELFDTEENKILKGETGKFYAVPYYGDTLVINVAQILAVENQEFKLVAIPLQLAVSSLIGALTIAEEGKSSGIIRVTLEHQYTDKLVNVLNDIADTYVRQNVEIRSEEARKALVFLNEQLPSIKAQLDSAEKILADFRHQKKTIDLGGETRMHLEKDVSLEQRLLELEQKKEESLRLFKAEHPAIKTIEKQQERLRRELARQNKAAQSLPKLQQEVIRLQEEVEVNSKLYTGLLNKIQELDVVQAREVGNVRIVDYAYVPLLPSKPKRKFILLCCVLAFLFLGVVIIIVRKMMRNGVTSSSEVEMATGVSVYGRIPQAKEKCSSSITDSYVLKEKDSPITEAFRALQVALEFALDSSTCKTILVTGLTPGVGKSFVSSNLAHILAQKQKKVLLVDCDIRRGYLLKGKPGLTNIIHREASATHITHINENLDIIGSGKHIANSAELINSQEMLDLIERMKTKYDLIILDSPPVLICSDALLLQKFSDFIVCILGYGMHSMEDIKDTMASLDRGIKEPLQKCFVMNRYEHRGGYGYGYYKKK